MPKNKVLRESGFKPMPTVLKVLFIFICIGLAGSVISLSSVNAKGVFMFGYGITGTVAWLISIFWIAVMVVLLTSWWNRSAWAWWYGIAYFIVSLINNIIMVFSIDRLLAFSLDKMPSIPEISNPQLFYSLMHSIMIFAFVIALIITIVFIVLFYRTRDYFDK